jgi:hypothetical protein
MRARAPSGEAWTNCSSLGRGDARHDPPRVGLDPGIADAPREFALDAVGQANSSFAVLLSQAADALALDLDGQIKAIVGPHLTGE